MQNYKYLFFLRHFIAAAFGLILCHSQVLAQPKAGIRVGTQVLLRGQMLTICKGSSITYFNEAQNATTIKWRFNKGTPSIFNGPSPTMPIVYNTGGIDTTWQFVSDATRSDSMFILINVTTEKPQVNFTFNPDGQCASTPVNFTNSTTGGNNLKYTWNFGDGKPGSSAINPTRIFETNPTGALSQTFQVKLVAKNDGNCSDSITKTITVKRTPDPSIDRANPNFEFIPNFNQVPTFRKCENVPSYAFEFKNTTQTLAAIVKYTIIWGDGSSDTTFTSWPLTGASIFHTYLKGNTTMTVKVLGTDGCEGIRNYNVFVGTTPAGGFASQGNTSICAPNSLNFVISEFANNPPGTQYRVSVNDGSPTEVFTHPPPTIVPHTFEKTSCGISSSNGASVFNNAYRAVLDVENPCGTTSVSVIPIYVSGKPKAGFIATPSQDICVNSTVNFFETNVYGGVITPAGGNSATCSTTGKLVWKITPVTGPANGFTIINGQTGNINNKPSESFFWTTGSGNLSVLFTQTGTYNIKIYAGNDLCGVDSTEKEICVRIPPTASFTMDKHRGCTPDEVTFTNNSPEGPCGGERYSWQILYADSAGCAGTPGYTFTNGTDVSSKNPKIRFDNAGRYIIELRVFTLASNCVSAVYRDTFFAASKPKVTLNNLSSICRTNLATPVATVSGCYSAGSITYAWTFGGGNPSSSNSLNPGTIRYDSIGSYPITIKATNDCGITEVTKTQVVTSLPVADAGPDRYDCSGVPTPIGTPGVPGVTYGWVPTTGLYNPSLSATTINRSYTGPDSVNVFIYVLTASLGPNCFTRDTMEFRVKRGPALAVSPISTVICSGGSATLTASGATSYSWTPAAGIANPTSPSITVSPTTSTTYKVVGTLGNGCYRELQSVVDVLPFPNVDAGNNIIACNNQSSFIIKGSPGGGTWSGSPFVTTGGQFNPIAAGIGVYTLFYSYTRNGCNGVDSMQVSVVAPPIAVSGDDTTVCNGSSGFLISGFPIGGSWSGSSLISSSGFFTPSAVGVFTLIYTIQSGTCISSDTTYVTVVPGVSNNIIGNSQNLCAGLTPAPLTGSIAMAGSQTVLYQWQSSQDSTSWNNLNGQTGQDLILPIPTQTLFYRRLASTATCTSGSPSNGVRININPGAKAVWNPSETIGCAPFLISHQLLRPFHDSTRNSSYRWYVNNTLLSAGQTFPGYTITGTDDSVILKLVAISLFGCANDSVSGVFKTFPDPTPSFNLSDTVGCGPLNITITNTTPSASRFNFVWDFGNGTQSTNIQPGNILFPVNPNRGDTIYTVILKATGGCDTFTVEKKIRVRARPRTIFTPDKSEGCSPLTVRFNNNSAGSNATFRWDFGDGSPSLPGTTGSVSHTFSTNIIDTFTVKLFGTNDCGTDTADFKVVVNPSRLILDFAINGTQVNGCAPHTVQFINNTIGANLFKWTFGDGTPLLTTTKGFDTITHVYTDTGRFVVTLFATNGCTDTTTTRTIFVSTTPKVSFTANPLTVCLGSPVNFTNTSDSALAWNWNFGDGTSSNLAQVSKTYSAVGTYRVVLKGTRAFPQGFSCTDSASVSVQVVSPRGNFNYQGGYYCPGQAATFEATNTNATRFRFYFGNGDSIISANPTVVYTYPQPGTYLPRVVLEAGGCLLSVAGVDSIRVDKLVTGFMSTQTAFCKNIPINFFDTSYSFFGIQQRSWQFGDGTGSTLANPSKVYTQSGNYVIRLKTTGNSGCVDSIEWPISIRPDAKAEMNPSSTIGCYPFQINQALLNPVYDSTRNGSYRWYVNNTFLSNTPAFPGYTITGPNDSVNISMVAISLFGCKSDSVSVTIKTLPDPSPSFTLSDTVGCGPLNITITNTTPSASGFSFIWDFGNGSQSINQQPGTILFPVNPNKGDTIYTVRLKAYGGCDTFSIEKKIRVRAIPRTLFTPDILIGCSPLSVTFTNHSVGSNAGFKWDFGDGSTFITGSTSPVTHVFTTNKTDTFNVRLLGTNDCGTDTANINIVVNPSRLLFDLSINGNELNGCLPHSVSFMNRTIGANVFNWNFGDGSPILTTTEGFDTITHIYTDTGRFVITVFAANGCKDTTATRTVSVFQVPKVSFSASPVTGCLGEPIQFNNTSDPGLTWNWNFGDGTTSTLAQVTKTYNAIGTYKVVLKGTRNFPQGSSCTDSATLSMQVITPRGDFSYRGGFYCPGQSTTFVVTNTNATRFRFYLGNGDSIISSNPNITFTYPQPGTYLPKVVLEFGGCTLSVAGLDSIRVDKLSTGFFTTQSAFCNNTPVNFFDTSFSFFGIQQRSWQFGDGTGSTLTNPSKLYTQSGNYIIRLRTTSNSGCADSIQMPLNVSIQQTPSVSITSDSVACSGQPIAFVAKDAANIANTFSWQFPGGNNQTGSQVSNIWNTAGIYTVRLVGRTSFGCADTVYKRITVLNAPLVNAGPDVTVCIGQSVQLNASGANSYQWNPLQGLSCTNCSNPVATPVSTTQYTVTGTNATGCSHTDTIVLKVSIPFDMVVSAGDSICASRNESVQLFASNAIRYIWSPSIGLNNANIPNPVARPATSTTYRVVGYDADNCFTDTGYVSIGVGTNPTLQLPAGGTFVAGTQVDLTPLVLTGGPFIKYTWAPDKDLSCNDCPNPVATVNTNILYRLTVETFYGCTASDTVSFKVNCQQDQIYIPNAFSPDGDGINDVLMVRGKGISRVKSFRIFNRMGQVVFERQNFDVNDPSAGWNGFINGVPAASGVYVYTAEAVCTLGASFVYKGNITLFR